MMVCRRRGEQENDTHVIRMPGVLLGLWRYDDAPYPDDERDALASR